MNWFKQYFRQPSLREIIERDLLCAKIDFNEAERAHNSAQCTMEFHRKEVERLELRKLLMPKEEA